MGFVACRVTREIGCERLRGLLLSICVGFREARRTGDGFPRGAPLREPVPISACHRAAADSFAAADWSPFRRARPCGPMFGDLLAIFYLLSSIFSAASRSMSVVPSKPTKKADQDLFTETTMTFGEHLEELRVCLWKPINALGGN